MNAHSTLATRFARTTTVVRSESPLSELQMREVAPSIFAPAKHSSRSERYAYIPTIEVLRGLGSEGFQPFMVAQGKSRIAGKSEFSKRVPSAVSATTLTVPSRPFALYTLPSSQATPSAP